MDQLDLNMDRYCEAALPPTTSSLLVDNSKLNFFLEFANTLVDLLLIELMLHLSYVKQMFIQTIHLTYEFK